jgi:hypothetical protein
MSGDEAPPRDDLVGGDVTMVARGGTATTDPRIIIEPAAADQIIDPVVVFYEPARIIRGREDLKRRAAAFRAAFRISK